MYRATVLISLAAILVCTQEAFAQRLRGAEAFAPAAPAEVNVEMSGLPAPARWQPGDPIRNVPRLRTGTSTALPVAGQTDWLAQRQQPSGTDVDFGTTLVNMDGLGFDGYNPPDTDGAVGPNHYIQIVNGMDGDGEGSSIVVIYNKSDMSIASGPFVLDDLGMGGCASGNGDGIVLYDQQADRWILTEFSTAALRRLCVYVSQTADPTAGSWFAYEFTAPDFPDYPKYAIWPDAYFVTTNESSPAVYAMQRQAMLDGQPAGLQRFAIADLDGFNFNTLTPVDIDGDTAPVSGAPGIFMRHVDDEAHDDTSPNPALDYLELWLFHVSWTNPGVSTFALAQTIAVSDFSSDLCGYLTFSCIPQTGTPSRLDPLREMLMWRLSLRRFAQYDALVGNMVSNVDPVGTPAQPNPAGIRWFELRQYGLVKGLGDWNLYQEGTWAPDSTHRWVGSMAMDGSGNIALAYNVSDDTGTFPGLRYTGQGFGEPTGLMSEPEHSVIEGASGNSGFRYGDYASMHVDPSDNCTFWFTGEYNQSPTWSTRIASFKFERCSGREDYIFGDGFEPPPNPDVVIEKLTNGVDADTPPGPEVAVGDPVDWFYFVQNTGNRPLTQVEVIDSEGERVDCPKAALASNEAMLCFAAGHAIDGQYSNVGTVTAIAWEGLPQQQQVSASDTSHYLGITP